MTTDGTPASEIWPKKHSVSFPVSREFIELVIGLIPPAAVKVPRPTEWLRGRDEFAEKYREIVELGKKLGYLDADHCFECGGVLEITTEDYTFEDPP